MSQTAGEVEQALARRVSELEKRLRAVEDVQAIQRLKARYGELVDARYTRRGAVSDEQLDRIARQVGELFTEDAEWDGGGGLGVCRGREAIVQRFREPTLSFSWHYFVKPQIQVDGDRASGTWDILAPCTSRDGEPLWMAGTEQDEYVREDGRWLHARMQLRVVFMAPHARGWGRAPRSGHGEG
ncbi:MAG: nuclear transport factor 2 family protein [Proteobacteria bacterium]|nr:nuclear transport factor 2 family protein [Pseudomonadota bacterium]